uniref:Uncharacterized protein n=1 Tax=Dunaliella tertiolecta TaxID=3047 RepID=A0A7S3VT66_DUNTE
MAPRSSCTEQQVCCLLCRSEPQRHALAVQSSKCAACCIKVVHCSAHQFCEGLPYYALCPREAVGCTMLCCPGRSCMHVLVLTISFVQCRVACSIACEAHLLRPGFFSDPFVPMHSCGLSVLHSLKGADEKVQLVLLPFRLLHVPYKIGFA